MAYATPQEDPNDPAALDAPVILSADTPAAVGSTPATSTVMDSGGTNPTVDGASTVKDSSSSSDPTGSIQMQPWSQDAQALVGNTSTPTQQASYSQSSSSPDWGAAMGNNNASFGGEEVTPDQPPAPTGPASSGTFKNINAYLNANSGSGVGNMAANQASSVIGGAQNDISNQNTSFNNAVQNGSTVSGTYSGPASFTGSVQGQQSLADTQLANQEAGLVNTAGGRTALLNQATSSTPMTQGGTALDQFLLQMNQPAMQGLKTATDTTGLNSQFNANTAAGNTAATTAQNTATTQAAANTAAANAAAQAAQTASINDTLNKQAAAQQALYAQQSAAQQQAYQQQLDAQQQAQAAQIAALTQSQQSAQQSQADQLAALLAQISASKTTVTPGGGTGGVLATPVAAPGSVPVASFGGLSINPGSSSSGGNAASLAAGGVGGDGNTSSGTTSYMTGDANGSASIGGLAKLGLGLAGMVLAPGLGSLINAISAVNTYVNNTPAPTAVGQPIDQSVYAGYTGDNTQGYTTGQTTPATDPNAAAAQAAAAQAAAQQQAQAEAAAQAQAAQQAQAEAAAQAAQAAQAEAAAQAAQQAAQEAANNEGDTNGGYSGSSESSSSSGGEGGGEGGGGSSGGGG